MHTSDERADLKNLVEAYDNAAEELLPILSRIFNILQKTPPLVGADHQFKVDMLDLGERLLGIPSHFFRDTFGGAENPTEKARGQQMLKLVCANATQRLTLVLPDGNAEELLKKTTLDDLSLLQSTTISKGWIKQSFSGNTDPNIDENLYVSELAEISDQRWILKENALNIVVRKQGKKDSEEASKRSRKKHEYAVKELMQGAFDLAGVSKFKEKLKEMELVSPENKKLRDSHPSPSSGDTKLNSLLSYRCDNLPVYTALALSEYIPDLIGIELEIVNTLVAVCDVLEVMEAYVETQKKTEGAKDNNRSKVRVFLDDVEKWWFDSPFKLLRDYGYGSSMHNSPERVTETYMKEVFEDRIKRPLFSLKKLIKKISVVSSMHPETKDAQSLSDLNYFSILFEETCSALFVLVDQLDKKARQVNDKEAINGNQSFLETYGRLRHQCTNFAKTNPKVSVSHTTAHPSEAFVATPSPSPSPKEEKDNDTEEVVEDTTYLNRPASDRSYHERRRSVRGTASAHSSPRTGSDSPLNTRVTGHLAPGSAPGSRHGSNGPSPRSPGVPRPPVDGEMRGLDLTAEGKKSAPARGGKSKNSDLRKSVHLGQPSFDTGSGGLVTMKQGLN